MIEVKAPDQIAVSVQPPEQVSVTVEELQAVSVVTIAAQGPPGPPGPSGSTNVGGHPVQVNTLRDGDLLVFAGSAWVNKNKVEISDGGNF